MPPAPDTGSLPPHTERAYALDYATLSIPEETLAPVRRGIYHSTGPGYHVFRGFLSPSMTQHIQGFWATLDPARVHQTWTGMHCIAKDCPNYWYGDPSGSRGFFNFLWNNPPDETTYAVSLQIQLLR